LVALVVVCVITGAGVVAANVVENQKLSGINRIDLPDNLLAPSKPGAPANYLIIGSDSRAFVDDPAEAQAFGTDNHAGLADVMMVVHVVPALGTAYVVSFPRDTYVNIPGHGMSKLNAALAYGGAALTIKTFNEDFGIPIQHYLEVNFVGFEKIVDAIGHVKIYFPTPARDFYTGLYAPTAGCVPLNGVAALAYARSRHYAIPVSGITDPNPQVRDDWNEDPRADLDRIKRQQYFLRSLGQTALEHGASNPITAIHLADAVASSLTSDKSLTNNDLKSLVRTFRGFNPAAVDMLTIPVTTDGSQLVVQYPEAQPVLNRLKDFSVPVRLPQAVKPSKIKVVVVNASGADGRAANVMRKLTNRGFRSGGFGDATTTNNAKTQVRYAPGAVTKGLTVGLYLGTSNVVEAANGTLQLGDKKLTGDVIVVIGNDYPSLHGLLSITPHPTTSTAGPGSSTTVAAPTTTSSTTTTTTTPVTTPDTRYIPTAPKSTKPLVGCPSKSK
jgi:polyisoprenyl-teichoic acid--peptidoglycan teichoic acid transferase